MYGSNAQFVTLSRDVDALLVPHGTEVRLAEGSHVHVVQTLGGTFTLVVNGNMLRVDGSNADALGLEADVMEYDTPTDGSVSNDDLWRTLGTIYDPEIPVSIVELGLIYAVEAESLEQGNRVHVSMTLTAPGCGMGPVLVEECRLRLLKVPNVSEVTVDLLFDPPWSHDMMSDAAKLELGMFY